MSQGVHCYLKKHVVPHIWNVDDGGQESRTWANSLHHFAARIFR